MLDVEERPREKGGDEWSPEAIEILRHGREHLGKTATEIAEMLAEIGIHRSRLAISTKSHVLGLRSPKYLGPTSRRPPPVEVHPVVSQRLIELADDQCRWPIGDLNDPSFRFCGEKKAPSQSYCPECARKAYKKVLIEDL